MVFLKKQNVLLWSAVLLLSHSGWQPSYNLGIFIKMLRFTFLTLIGFITLLAAPLDEALLSFKAKEYNKAFTLYEQEAKKENTKAQRALSYLYFNGLGAQKSQERGFYWLNKAAYNLDTTAQYDLGMMYLNGQNMEQKLDKAKFWLERAADLDHPQAQYNLALMYYRGDATDQNVSKAAIYLDKAARNGDVSSEKIVGRIYMHLIKFDKAIPWLEKNAQQGDVEAAYFIGEIYCSQNRYDEAKPWLDQAVNGGYDKAEQLRQTCKPK